MLVSAVLTLGRLCLQLHFYLQRYTLFLPCYYLVTTLFLSFKVRACCDSAVDFTASTWFPSTSLWSLKSESPAISTWPSKESALPGGVFVDLVLEESSLRSSAALRLLTVACITARNQTVASYLFLTLKCPSTSGRPSLKKILVVSNAEELRPT